jgi:anti-sigma regulatory factor (Ser/Thr protein kinase)
VVALNWPPVNWPLTAPAPQDMRWLGVEDASAVSACRNAVLTLASRLEFPSARADQLALAVTEAASNLHKHAQAGSLLLRVNRDETAPGIELVTIDAGPGVADVDAAMRDGHSTAGSLGIGLGAIRRLADFSDLYSVPNHGTALIARFRPEPGTGSAGPASPHFAGLTRPITGEHECGDVYGAVQTNQGQTNQGQTSEGQTSEGQTSEEQTSEEQTSWRQTSWRQTSWRQTSPGPASAGPASAGPASAGPASDLRAGEVTTAVLCDGLGHGPLAAAAAAEGVAAVLDDPAAEPVALLERVHRRMSGTRGGAVGIVQIRGPVARYAGLGNIAACVLHQGARKSMLSVPGIAGHQARSFRQFEYEVPPGAAVILHSDGISSRWQAAALPGLDGRDPLLIAATLLGQAGIHRDDAGVLVLSS